ncbi:MAG: hypothetical protein LBD58_10865 [Treponema sp.]|jgi:hypothetical protein|nr:hypothetical protein [Treponema sp.]
MKGKCLIPQADEEFREWGRNFIKEVLENAAAWGVPQAESGGRCGSRREERGHSGAEDAA